MKNKSADILGHDFECKDDREPEQCPLEQGNIGFATFNDETGEWSCSECGGLLDIDNTVSENELFDEEEPGEMGVNNEQIVVAEADGGVLGDFTDKQRLRVDRVKLFHKMLLIARDYPRFKFVEMLVKEGMDYVIVDRLTILEDLEVKGFEGGRHAKNIIPKLLALAVHETKILPPGILKDKRIRISPKNFQALLQVIEINTRSYTDINIETAMYSLGEQLGIPKAQIKIILDDLEEQNLPNKETDPTAKAAAWIWLTRKKHGLEITKKSLTALPTVPKNRMNSAINSYKKSISKLNDHKIK